MGFSISTPPFFFCPPFSCQWKELEVYFCLGIRCIDQGLDGAILLDQLEHMAKPGITGNLHCFVAFGQTYITTIGCCSNWKLQVHGTSMSSRWIYSKVIPDGKCQTRAEPSLSLSCFGRQSFSKPSKRKNISWSPAFNAGIYSKATDASRKGVICREKNIKSNYKVLEGHIDATIPTTFTEQSTKEKRP